MQWRIKMNITARWYNWDKKTWTWNPSLMCTPRNAKKTLQSPSKASRQSQVPSWPKSTTSSPTRSQFHLTCPKQEEQMEKIRSNCSSLSRQVEDKFQSYLNNVGAKVSSIQKQSSRLEVQNAGLTSELDKCKTDREKEAAESSKKLQDAQQKYDKQLEQLLKEQSRLRDAKDLLEARLSVNDATLISLRNGCTQQVGVLLGWMMMLKTAGKSSMVAIFSLIACLKAVERIVIN